MRAMRSAILPGLDDRHPHQRRHGPARARAIGTRGGPAAARAHPAARARGARADHARARHRHRARLGRRGTIDLDAAATSSAASCSAASSASSLGIERRLERLGDRLQARLAHRTDEHSTVSEGFVTASLLFCVGSLTVVGSIQDGLTGDYQLLATKSVLDGFASIALVGDARLGRRARGDHRARSSRAAITLGAGLFEDILVGEALAALTSAGGVTIIGIALKLLDIKDVKVGNFLPALVIAPRARRRSPAPSDVTAPAPMPPEARRADEPDRRERRRCGRRRSGAVALLDRRHRGVLAPPGERPDDREAGRDRRRPAG